MGLCDGFMYVMLYGMYLKTKAIYNKTIDKINVYDVILLNIKGKIVSSQVGSISIYIDVIFLR